MYKYLLVLILIMVSLAVRAQIPQVPQQMDFAGMKLKITPGAREVMQKQVNSLRASEKYFRIKMDRVNLFFPIIERVFREENLPDDFKYLVIQESALISDAVSSSNAVGFWQFKDFTGREVGLRIDSQVDERANIVSATHGAAIYLKKNNFYFKNWVYALMAYNTGRGGARKYVKDENLGVTRMTIDRKTHWYVLTFLAHKVAFRDELGGNHSKGLVLQEYTRGTGRNLKQIADKFGLDRELVSYYNRWLKRGNIPDDKTYTVILPVKERIPDRKLQKQEKDNLPVAVAENKKDPEEEPEEKVFTAANTRKLKPGLEYANTVHARVNGLRGIVATAGDNVASLSAKTRLLTHRFRKYNDLAEDDDIQPGKIYYAQKKRSRSAVKLHVLGHNESLWDVAQKYGIRLKKLRKLNRTDQLSMKPGTVLSLSKRVSRDHVPVIMDLPEPQPVKQAPIRYDQDKKDLPGRRTGENKKPATANSTIDKVTAEPEVVKSGTITGNLPEGKQTGKTGPEKVKTAPLVEKTGEPVPADPEPGKALVVKEVVKKPVGEAQEEDNFDLHEVAPGETFYAISRRYGVTVEELTAWNNIAPGQTALQVGQKLQVKRPVAVPEEVGEIPDEKVLYHTVQPGETVYGISKTYDLEPSQLIAWNKLGPEAGISIGQKLQVSGIIVEQRTSQETVTSANPGSQQPGETPAADLYHEVKPGETLYSLSRKYNIPVKDLIRINNKQDATIKIGERLKVKAEN